MKSAAANDAFFTTWFPVQASTFAKDVDLLYAVFTAISVFFSLLIFGAVLYFCIRYRRQTDMDRPAAIETSKALEITWSLIPFIIVAGMFHYGAVVFFEQTQAPANCMDILGTGKKWMWKFQHPSGRREINALHVPVDQPIRITASSEDVIHDIYVPAFRVKHDVMPGRYTYLWFQPTKVGEYSLFCNQYCGTQHSYMKGSVTVMEQADYQKWLADYTGETPVQRGEALFTKLACNTCHMAGINQRGPVLNGVFGTRVPLHGGGEVVADANYIQESILNPQARVVAGFGPLSVMPSFQGQVGVEEIGALLEYIKSLPVALGSAPSASPSGSVAPPAAPRSDSTPTTKTTTAAPQG